MVHLAVKRPRDPVHKLSLAFEQNGSVGGVVDIASARAAWAGASTLAASGSTRPAATAEHSLAGQALIQRASIDNLTNRRAWQEAPYQFGHADLYPLTPRAIHASVQLAL